jgi:hypothetical protein
MVRQICFQIPSIYRKSKGYYRAEFGKTSCPGSHPELAEETPRNLHGQLFFDDRTLPGTGLTTALCLWYHEKESEKLPD